MSGLIWIKTVLHSDGIPEKMTLKKKQQATKKTMKNYPADKDLKALFQIMSSTSG